MNGKLKGYGTPLCFCLMVILLSANVGYSLIKKINISDIEKFEFRADELYISQSNVSLEQVIGQLSNRTLWQEFLEKSKGSIIYIAPRSGRPATLITAIPIIPGTGDRNQLSLSDISQKLGYEVKEIREPEIKQLILAFVREHADLLGLNVEEIGEIRIGNPVDYLWQISIRRAIHGIPVRNANISFTINHGNLVLWGIENWGTIEMKLIPSITKEAALQSGFAYIGGIMNKDKMVSDAHLELVPVEPAGYAGTLGNGYAYRLVWTYAFQRQGYNNTWETLVDAHSGKVVSFQDTNQYILKKIVGAIYPVSSDECCPEGCASSTGMPLVSTGLTSPNDARTDFNGLYNYVSGTACTNLSTRYITMGADSCTTGSECSSDGDGNIDLDGVNGQHDCAMSPGHSTTFARRTAEAELTGINREARGWVNYGWLDCSGVACINVTVNINGPCGAYYSGNTINFYRTQGGCRNTGEIAGVFDHEWGHGYDSYDAAGVSNPGELFSDAIASLRLHQSCIGRGFWWTLSRGCGQWPCPTNPSYLTGYNCSGYGDCCTGCTGIRDSDYAKHASGIPHTPANYICVHCSAGSGPCGKEVHCENAPAAEAVWDLPARDLPAAPFNFDQNTSFQIAKKLLYAGGGGVTNWYTCTCPSTSGGCATTNGYLQFLTADDDDGNINNGTPHMTAIYNAYNRHGIACATPAPQNSGCVSGPTIAPVLTAVPTSNGVQLSWTSVPGAAYYRISKSMGVMGCDFGEVLIAQVATTSYLDAAMDCNANSYIVQPVGSNSACLGPASNCVTAMPPYPAPSNVTATASEPNEVIVSWDTVTGASGYNVYRKYFVCGSDTEEKIAENSIATNFIDSPVAGGIAYQYRVVAVSSCGEVASSDWVSVVPTGDCALKPCFNGIASASNNQTSSCGITLGWSEGISSCSAYPTLKYDIYRSSDPAFVPGPANMIAICVSGTSYLDATPSYGVTYYYEMRAEDNRTGGNGPCNGGDIDSNATKKDAAATGPFSSLFVDDFEAGISNWTISSHWQWSTLQAHSGTHSAWSNNTYNQNCDTLSESALVAIPAGSYALLHFWTYFNIEIEYDNGIVYGSSNGTTFTKLALTPNYPGSSHSSARACLGTNPQPTFNGVGTTWTEYTSHISSYAGSNFVARFAYASDGYANNGGWYIDDVLITYGSACAIRSEFPGRVGNNFIVVKSGTDLQMTWISPGGVCTITGFSLYRGSLPWIGYNHASINCDITGTTANIPQDTDNYYYLVVPHNQNYEGSCGKDSAGTERPPAAVPCYTPYPQMQESC